MTPEHEDGRESLATAFIVVVLAFVFMSLFISSVGAAEYTVTVERSAYSVRVESEQSEKPLLFMYTTSNCEPCETAKRELKAAKDLPFDVVFDAKPTITVESFPTLHWSNERGHWQTSGWDGVEKLEATWKSSQEQNQRTQTSTRYRARWTWPGDLRQHLRATHGITESLTQEQAERVHDALHEGYTVSQIRAYAKSKGYIR